MDATLIIRELKKKANPANVLGMARYGISSKNTLGVSIPALRTIAKQHKKQHVLALKLWNSKIHEARILAALVDDPALVTEQQMEAWVKEFDSWDVCDQVCSNLFDKTPFAYKKIFEWTIRKEEYVKRAGFVLMACLAVHDKTAKDEAFIAFFPSIKKGANDERNFVKKAVNWALRQIGKRNARLKKQAILLANEIALTNEKSARWIAKDALRELQK